MGEIVLNVTLYPKSQEDKEAVSIYYNIITSHLGTYRTFIYLKYNIRTKVLNRKQVSEKN